MKQHGSTSLTLTLLHSTNTLLDCDSLYHGSTSLDSDMDLLHSTLALLLSTRLTSFQFILLDLFLSTKAVTLLDSTSLYHGSTSFYTTLLHSSKALVDSASFSFSHGSTLLNMTLFQSTITVRDSTSFIKALVDFTMALIHST